MTSMTHDSPQITGRVDTHGLTHHVAVIDSLGRPLVKQAAPELLALFGVGPETAGQLLASAGATQSACARRPRQPPHS
ncbi:hypothetical protein [Streptomyces profundus]|uniref:hypothetical protein n=1 Tax=Streptomyces profundus TaxID=2867410 RepID=UPI001D1692A6|nr:hypothetical protein [Streptomyces sp. MA3_2.13]UED88814.1 hypothetical protein K4G22_15785 [Streptomyces sp. MA3_2.13]